MPRSFQTRDLAMSPSPSHSKSHLVALNARPHRWFAGSAPGRTPERETGKIRSEAVVENVAVWATSRCTGPTAKPRDNQLTNPVDRRHEPAPKLSVADVAYSPSRCLRRSPRLRDPMATELAEIAEIAQISMKWAP